MQFRDSPEPHSAPKVRAPALILLVEDDFILRAALSEHLAAEGFRVDCCADGREAFYRLHSPPKPHLILLDVMLPHLDGLELRSLQKKMPIIAHVPVIAMSAYDVDPRSLEGLDLSPVFRKPLDLDRLLSRIRDLTGRA